MTLLGFGVLVAGVLALLAREIAAVRLHEPRGPAFGVAEVLVVLSLLLLAPRMVELLT